ncbi:MAG: TonB-dependent receptor domain-containing protein [Rhodobacterales bacterium]
MPVSYLPAPKARLLLSVTLAALATSPALAQEAATGGFTPLGRLILGAGTEKVAIDTPQAVTSIEQEELDRDQPANVNELFKAVPGVQGAGASARPLGQAFNIRGIGNTEQNASEARIIVTVDGAPKFFEQYRMGSFFGDLDLYKRVEVLRGPASSTLYGTGAIGGVINFTTKDASDFLEPGQATALRFKAGYDSNGKGLRGGVIFASRPADNVELLGAINRSSGDDQKDGSGRTLPGTAYERWSGLAKGTYRFGNDSDQSVTLSLSRTDTKLKDTVVAQTGGAAVSGFGFSDIRSIDDTATLTWRHEAVANPFVDLTVGLSFTDTNVEKDNFSFAAMCGPGQLAVLCDSDYGYRTVSLKVENTAELSTGAWQNFLTVGMQLSEQQRSATSSVGSLGFHPEGTDRKLGIYAQGELVWNDRLTLIPGVRVDFGELTPSAAAAAAGGTKQSETAISPKLAAMYKFNDNWSVFGSVARTERMPTLDELYSTEGPAPRGPGLAAVARTASLNLEPEKADTVELGFTFQRMDVLSDGDAFQFKATAFRNDITDLIATSPRPILPVGTPVSVPYFSNINEARIWGAEIEASYDAALWFAQLAYSQVRSEDRSTGLTLPDTPAENAVFTLGAKIPEQNMTVGWRASFYDDITTSSATTTADSYNTHDLFATWSPDRGALRGLDVNLAINNVFDATYRNNLAQDNAPGRTISLSIAKTF